MNKLQTKLHDIMLSILPFEEFRQNDIIEEEINGSCQFICYADNMMSYILGKNGMDEIETEYIKFISRDWTLNDLLMCLNHKHLIIKEIVCMTYKDISIQYPAMINNKEINVMIDYDLTKNLLDQDNLKEIIEVLS